MTWERTEKEEKCWRRELEQTEYYFLQMELKNRNVHFPPDYRKYVEQRVEELRLKFGPDRIPAA